MATVFWDNADKFAEAVKRSRLTKGEIAAKLDINERSVRRLMISPDDGGGSVRTQARTKRLAKAFIRKTLGKEAGALR